MEEQTALTAFGFNFVFGVARTHDKWTEQCGIYIKVSLGTDRTD
jgi:hypothetical protein